MPNLLSLAQKMISGELPPPPVAQLVGFQLVAIESGQAIMEMQTDKRHANAMGPLHGGVLCDIADAAMGMAFASTLDDDESFTTLEMKINFVKPVWNAKLKAIGKVIKAGNTIGLVECDVTDENDQLVAHATSTCMVLRGDKAAGR